MKTKTNAERQKLYRERQKLINELREAFLEKALADEEARTGKRRKIK